MFNKQVFKCTPTGAVLFYSAKTAENDIDLLQELIIFAKENGDNSISNLDLSGRDFSGIIAGNITFYKCKMVDTKFKKGKLHNVAFMVCNLTNSTFEHGILVECAITRSRCKNTKFNYMKQTMGEMTRNDMGHADFTGYMGVGTRLHCDAMFDAKTKDADFEQCHLHSVFFSKDNVPNMVNDNFEHMYGQLDDYSFKFPTEWRKVFFNAQPIPQDVRTRSAAGKLITSSSFAALQK
jgi:uncharacterized protein YjbI with pentapeptide repeats